MAGLLIVPDSWPNDASTPKMRGRTLAVYMVVSMGGLAVGQAITAFVDIAGYVLFILASVLVVLAVKPVTLAATTKAPLVRKAERLGPSELYRTVSTGLIGMLFDGVPTEGGATTGLGAFRVGLRGYVRYERGA